jgi:hypothetical protein
MQTFELASVAGVAPTLTIDLQGEPVNRGLAFTMIGNSVRAIGSPFFAVRVAVRGSRSFLLGSSRAPSFPARQMQRARPEARSDRRWDPRCVRFLRHVSLPGVQCSPDLADRRKPRATSCRSLGTTWSTHSIARLLAYIALNPRRIPRTAATRLLTFALLWLVVSFGLWSASTSLRLAGPLRIWVDAIVLPAILFVSCERYCLLGADRLRRLGASRMIEGGIPGAIGIVERIAGFELATLTGGNVRFDANIDTTRISVRIRRQSLTYSAWQVASLRPSTGCSPASAAAGSAGLSSLPVVKSLGSRSRWSVPVGQLRSSSYSRGSATAQGDSDGRLRCALVAVLALAATTQLVSNKTVATRLKNTQNISGRLGDLHRGFGHLPFSAHIRRWREPVHGRRFGSISC